jgi:peptidoglycan/LPS O-acetylase OafA/YrhL
MLLVFWSFALVAAQPACLEGVSAYCCAAVDSDDDFLRLEMLLASGTSAPFSAGDYLQCENTAGSRYFLVRAMSPLHVDGRTVSVGQKATLLGEVGICVPEVCTKQDIEASLDDAWVAGPLPVPLSDLDISIAGPEDIVQPDAGTYITIGLFACLAALVLGATLSDPGPAQRRSLAGQALSAKENISKLLGRDANRQTASLNGVRVISISWIVLGHTFMMAGATAGYGNEADIMAPGYGDKGSAFLATVASAELAVDTFFFLSGYLLVVSQLPKLTRVIRAKAMPGMYASAVLYRYLRLTPSVAVVLLFFVQLAYHMGDGPFFPRHQNDITRRCWSWWTELLYVQNYYPWDSDSVCMGWTWYLGNEMIFFMLGFPLLLIYPSSRRAAWISGIVLCVASLAYSSYVTIDKHLGIYLFDHQYADYCYWLYSKPHHRLPAYLIGIGSAMLLPATPEFKENLSHNARRGLLVGAVISTAALVFLTLCSMGALSAPDAWGEAPNYVYIVWARPAWAIACSIIASACALGAWEPINAFLSWSAWTPLARLTYGCYLCHPVIIKTLAAYEVDYYTYSHYEVCARWTMNLVMSFAASALLFLGVERPCLTVTNYMIRGPPKPAKLAEAETSAGRTNPTPLLAQ